MSMFKPDLVKYVKTQSEAITGMLGVMYEMALMLVKIESNEKLFEFIEEYQKNMIEKGVK